jgi:hypothetical protein
VLAAWSFIGPLQAGKLSPDFLQILVVPKFAHTPQRDEHHTTQGNQHKSIQYNETNNTMKQAQYITVKHLTRNATNKHRKMEHTTQLNK